MPRKPAKQTSVTFIWRGLTCCARHERDYLSPGWSHIEVALLKPKDAPLPITTTGYRSHFLAHDELVAAGGLVPYFLAWLDREATTKVYAKRLAAYQQLDLFKAPP